MIVICADPLRALLVDEGERVSCVLLLLRPSGKPGQTGGWGKNRRSKLRGVNEQEAMELTASH